MKKRLLPSLCLLWFVLLSGCATNPRFSLDPLKSNNSTGNDPLKGGNAMAKNDGRMPGTARLLAPDTASTGSALTSAPAGEFKPLGTNTLAPSLGALAANTRPRTDATTANDGSPFGAAKTAPVKQAQWNAAGATATGGFTWEQAKEQLSQRGVTSYHLERRDGQWTFRCSLPNPENPSLSRTYEATATNDLDAVQQVLDSLAGR